MKHMPRPIIMTDDMKQQALADFTETLNSIKMSDGKLSYNRSFKYDNSKALVCIAAEAYKKIIALVTEFSDEVGWHGTVSRAGNSKSDSNEFIVEDIFVYPQEVTGSTVTTDQEAYTKWLYELDDDVFNNLRMQGHSHCNMGVSPSGVDDKHREQILEQLEPDMFYVFMIWNKSLKVNTLVYDMANNILYEDDDVEVKLLDSDDMKDFLADAKGKVKKPSYNFNRNSNFGANNKSGYKKSKSKSKGKEQISSKNKKGEKAFFDDEFDELGFYEHYGMYDLYNLGGPAWKL